MVECDICGNELLHKDEIEYGRCDKCDAENRRHYREEMELRERDAFYQRRTI